ncbi:MAG: SIMPL domain-containing protein [Parvularculaceae bacterium]
MRKIIAPAAAAAIAACSAAPVAHADAPTASIASRTIVVSGLGEVTGTPDMAVLSIGVDSQAPTAAAALKDNGVKMNATIARLKARGVAEKDMQTQSLSVNPLYKYDNNGSAPRITGYQASNILSVKLRDLGAAGSVIDDAVSDGANNLGGISFTFADAKPLMDKARTAAVEDARRRAELLAKAAGVGLGLVLQINDGYAAAPVPGPMYRMDAMAAEAKSTPISAGEATISANVTIVYEIK